MFININMSSQKTASFSTPPNLNFKYALLTVTRRLGPYANSEPIPTRTLNQLEHFQLGHCDKPTRTLYQLVPHDYVTNSDPTQTLLIGPLVEHSRTLWLHNQLEHYTWILRRNRLNAITECNVNWELYAYILTPQEVDIVIKIPVPNSDGCF